MLSYDKIKSIMERLPKTLFLLPLMLFALIFVAQTGVKAASSANIGDINFYNSEFNIEMIPSSPGPNEKVSAKAVSYQFDMDRSSITWTLDGKIIGKGLGKKDIEFLMPDYGKKKQLTVSIVTDKGISTSKTISFEGNDIDFLWESDTTVPAGYKGKALPAFKSLINVYAIPHLFLNGSSISNSGLVYEWSLNYKRMPESSGQGKNTFLFRLADLDEYVVGLNVTSRDGKAGFQKYFTLSAGKTKQKILFYKDNPLEGPDYNIALSGDMDISSSGMSLRAEPYYFTGSNLYYKWSMNGKKLDIKGFPNVLSLRSESGGGVSKIGIRVAGAISNIFQNEENFIKINF